ncbi:hypothetical protein D8674_022260 [Pyrus ussuriensis x Pyrus communis]|uniref:Uncharacterized protein n=1 Tax=Pyrus ussuriensis x Pyrus communis TaxID=2448454 RepID=A0A5N5GPV6_9ROSA|nr:hypothetical protein D8674_022260 [Pyrus ussuriensis x Pyrus communis]
MSQKSSSLEQQDPYTDPKCGRNTDHGETETHGFALKRYASISLQLCGLGVFYTNSSRLILCAITCLHPCIS